MLKKIKARRPAPRDTSIVAYQAKRDFSQTSEPAPSDGTSVASEEQLFVVQKHQASRLHYDFRLQALGVLWSWAVPKGIPTQDGDKRLAMRTEDHPIEYARFEGIIPPGNYGAGTVMVWDIGRYSLRHGTLADSMKKGRLSLNLEGKKLKGDWTLFRARTSGHSRKPERETWYLLKSHGNVRLISARRDNQSALTGRTMNQIATNPGAQWMSRRPGQAAPSPSDQSTFQLSERLRCRIAAQPEDPPRFLKPMGFQKAKTAPKGDHWVYEMLFDGFRALAIKVNNTVEFRSPTGKNLEARFPALIRAIRQLPVSSLVLDGDIVALDEAGRPSRPRLKTQGREVERVVFCISDLLNLEGSSLVHMPLEERREVLAALLTDTNSPVRLAPQFEASATTVISEFKKHGLTGLLAKRRFSQYEPGQDSDAWQEYHW